jgi:hypothetical protein
VIVIAKKVGRLANRMLLFAHFVAAAAEHGLVVVNPAFGAYAHYFPATARDLLCRFPARRAVPSPPGSRQLLYYAAAGAAEALHARQRLGKQIALIRLRRDDELDLNSDAFLDVVRAHRIVLVQDWFFRNTENCSRHRDVVRSYFSPSESCLGRARAAIEPARRRDRLIVGVHVRQGDYRTFKDGRFYYSHEQYRGVMASVEAAFPDKDVSFFVCSDAAVPREAFAGFDVLYGSGHELDDLYAFAECDRLVGPPSTYTKWASYYGDVPRYVIRDPGAAPAAASFETDRGLGRERLPSGEPLSSTLG